MREPVTGHAARHREEKEEEQAEKEEDLFYLFYRSIVQVEFFHGKFGSLCRGKQAATETRYPTYGAWWVC